MTRTSACRYKSARTRALDHVGHPAGQTQRRSAIAARGTKGARGCGGKPRPSKAEGQHTLRSRLRALAQFLKLRAKLQDLGHSPSAFLQ